MVQLEHPEEAYVRLTAHRHQLPENWIALFSLNVDTRTSLWLLFLLKKSPFSMFLWIGFRDGD